jgi:hypothetical protein
MPMPTQSPIPWVKWAVSRGAKTVEHEKLTIRLRISGAKSQLHLIVCMDTAHCYGPTDISFSRIQVSVICTAFHLPT